MDIKNIDGKWVVHFMSFITAQEDKEEGYSLNRVSNLYSLALYKAKSFNGKRFHKPSFGGGIAFPSEDIALLAAKTLSNDVKWEQIELLKEAQDKFEKAAKMWERYNDMDNSKKVRDSSNKSRDNYLRKGEKLVQAVFPKTVITYPGLYPNFLLENGKEYYSITAIIRQEIALTD